MKSWIVSNKCLFRLCLTVAVAISMGCSDYKHWAEVNPNQFVKELAEDYRILLPPASDGLITYHAALHEVREGFVIFKVDGPIDLIRRVEEMIEPEQKYRPPAEDVTTIIQNIRVSDNINWLPNGPNINARLYQLKPLGENIYKMSAFVFPGNESASVIFYFSPKMKGAPTK